MCTKDETCSSLEEHVPTPLLPTEKNKLAFYCPSKKYKNKFLKFIKCFPSVGTVTSSSWKMWVGTRSKLCSYAGILVYYEANMLIFQVILRDGPFLEMLHVKIHYLEKARRPRWLLRRDCLQHWPPTIFCH